MASYDGSIRINTSLNSSNFNNGIKSMLTGLKSLAGAVGVAFSIGALVKFSKEAVGLASDIAEVDNVVSKSFGSMRGEMDALANNSIKTLGMSRLTAYKTGSTFMSMGKSMLDSAEDAKNMALELTKLTGNMSSFYNVSQDLASIALKSIYTGETETLKQYGVVMTEVNLKQFALEQGLTKSYSAMSQSEKVALRYQYVMKQLSFIGDDFIDTQDSWANQTRILSEQWKEFMSIVGTGLITVLTPVISVLNTIVGSLITFANAVGQVLSSLFGIKAQTLSVAQSASDVASGYDEATDSLKDYTDATNKANKAAKQGLSSLDEFNNITTNSGSGAGSAGGVGGGGIDIAEVAKQEEEAQEGVINKLESRLEKLKSFVATIQTAFTQGFNSAIDTGTISEKIEQVKTDLLSIGGAIKEIFTDTEVKEAFSNLILTWVATIGSSIGSVTSIGLSIAQGVTGGISIWLSNNKENIKKYLVDMFDITSDIGGIVQNFNSALARIATVFSGPNAKKIIANVLTMFSTAFMQASLVVANFGKDVINLISSPIVKNAPKLEKTLNDALGIVATVSGTIKEAVETTFTEFTTMYMTYISPLFESIGNGLSSILSTFLDFWNNNLSPILKQMASDFDDLMKSYIQPLINNVISLIGDIATCIDSFWNNVLVPFINWIVKNILPLLLPVIQSIWTTIKQFVADISVVLNGIITVLKNIMQFISNVFKGDWESAWKNIAKIIDTIWATIGSTVKTAVNLMKNIITTGLNAIKTVWNTIWTSLKATVTTVFNGIWSFIKGTINYIIGGIEGMANGIIKGINTVIKALNGLSIDVPDWVPGIGGGKLGFNLTEMNSINIPRLANGGITTGSTLANIGEAGREAVLPLEQNTEWMDVLADKLASKTQVTFQVEGDPNRIFKVTQKEAHDYFMRTGNPAFGY